jgi:hypothetical protein
MDEARVERDFSCLRSLIDSWLASKGELRASGDELRLYLKDGRVAEILREGATAGVRETIRTRLTESTESGLFQTSVEIARTNRLLVYAELRAAGGPYQVGPLRVDVRCPAVIRNIIDYPIDWYVGQTLVASKPFDFSGPHGGRELAGVIWHPERNLPVLTISDGGLTDTFSDDLARDLCGIAIVANLDHDASVDLIRTKGKEWACYNGAIRIYWPRINLTSDPFAHPLWTRHALLRRVGTPEDAAALFRRQMRRRLMGMSAFAVAEPQEIRDIRRDVERDRAKRVEKELRDKEDYQALAETYATERDQLYSKLQARELELEQLRTEVTNLQLALQWQPGEADEAPPQQEMPPTTVQEAVDSARRQYGDTLIFGPDVDEGMKTLATDAGPPEKIGNYLYTLSTLVTARRAGPLGTSSILWLRDHGAIASNESETTGNSAAERQKRTWRDGKGRRYFDMHLKPNEAVAPDRCVRIYFDYDEEAGRIIIGWVGRHP